MNWRTRLLGLALLAPLMVLATAATPRAQEWNVIEDAGWCDEADWGDGYCEVRETTIAAGRDLIDVDAGPNGGVSVRGWDRTEIRIRAKIRVWSEKDLWSQEERAKETSSKIEIVTGETIQAKGPRRGKKNGGWSVSFELMVPEASNLLLAAHNGGISIDRVRGKIRFETKNGGVRLRGVGGDVEGETVNGGVAIRLEGESWNGDGLDVRTKNGGVRMEVPQDYSAELVTGTVNGGIVVDFPIDFDGRIGKRLSTQLGDGGATLRVVTKNGGVKIEEI